MQVISAINSIYQQATSEDSLVQKNKYDNSFASVMAETKNHQVLGDSNAAPNGVFAMDTNQGQSKVNLDEYLNPTPKSGSIDIRDITLLLPTEHNINTLSKYSEAKFKDLLQHYNIPSPPATIEFDGEGKLILSLIHI